MDRYVQKVDDSLNSILNSFIKKPTIIRGILHLFLILYAARIAPSLPKPVFNLFDNQYFKLFTFALILWTAQFSPSTSLLIALGFLITVNHVNQRPLWEFLENVDASPPIAKVVETGQATPEHSADAVKALADAAATPAPAPAPVVAAAANIALAHVSTQDAAEAVQQLAQQATQSAPAPAQQVAAAASVAVADIASSKAETAPVPAVVTAPAESGCYPVRHYDMEKVIAFGNEPEFGNFSNA
jgi:hypothetical protein